MTMAVVLSLSTVTFESAQRPKKELGLVSGLASCLSLMPEAAEASEGAAAVLSFLETSQTAACDAFACGKVRFSTITPLSRKLERSSPISVRGRWDRIDRVFRVPCASILSLICL